MSRPVRRLPAEPVRWRSALAMLAISWLCCAVTYPVLRLTEGGPPGAALVAMMLGHWYVRHRRHIWPGVTAALTGFLGLFLLLEPLRGRLDKLTADTLATAAAVLPAITVFTALTRLPRKHPTAHRHQK